MTSILDSFRNSSMPKRLLRYALSRFDVLDADALNLDNLDLAWGRNTVLEFRDVGLKLKVGSGGGELKTSMQRHGSSGHAAGARPDMC